MLNKKTAYLLAVSDNLSLCSFARSKNEAKRMKLKFPYIWKIEQFLEKFFFQESVKFWENDNPSSHTSSKRTYDLKNKNYWLLYQMRNKKKKSFKCNETALKKTKALLRRSQPGSDSEKSVLSTESEFPKYYIKRAITSS